MKLIEVIFLTGTHCVSPIQHAAPLTEVFKVNCAVVVVQDTTANTISISPSTEAANPLVVEVVGRLVNNRAATAQTTPTQDEIPDQTPAAEEPVPAAPPAAELVQAVPVVPPASVVEDQSPDPLASEPAAAGRSPALAPLRQAGLSTFNVRPEVIAPNQPAPVSEPETANPEPASADVADENEEVAREKPKAPSKKAKTTKKKKVQSRTRSGQCGKSRTAVWYTNKDGRRKYRCARIGGPQIY